MNPFFQVDSARKRTGCGRRDELREVKGGIRLPAHARLEGSGPRGCGQEKGAFTAVFEVIEH